MTGNDSKQREVFSDCPKISFSLEKHESIMIYDIICSRVKIYYFRRLKMLMFVNILLLDENRELKIWNGTNATSGKQLIKYYFSSSICLM